ncbi:MAG: hypothetical protein E3J56_00900 [Candidatus Aminicenantes bacterium]|nr:MAG: hypothetical protein E3J56_00900 [Candidatus Aminicenantes bacterium]
MRCSAIASTTGKQCRAQCLQNEDVCLFHSTSETARAGRAAPGRPISRRRMIFELQRQLREVTASAAEPLEKSREIRAIITQINNLKIDGLPSEEKEEEPKKKNTFEERVKKSMESEEK